MRQPLVQPLEQRWLLTINEPPAIEIPPPQATDLNEPLVFHSGGNAPNAIEITDPDAGTDPIQVTLGVTDGTLTLATTAGLSVTGDGTDLVTLTGTFTAINTALDGLQFDPPEDESGVFRLDISADDLGNSGTGGAQSASRALSIGVAHTNQPPTIAVEEPDGVLLPNTSFILAGIQIADPDANGSPVQLVLEVASGTIDIDPNVSAGVEAGQINGNGTTRVVLVATPGAIQATLDDDGVTYSPDTDFAGRELVRVELNDLGNAGIGGTRSVSAEIDLRITEGPVNLGPARIATDPATSVDVRFSDDHPIQVASGDAADVSVELEVNWGTLTFTPALGLTSHSGDDTQAISMVGSLEDVNASLATLVYDPAVSFRGEVELHWTTALLDEYSEPTLSTESYHTIAVGRPELPPEIRLGQRSVAVAPGGTVEVPTFSVADGAVQTDLRVTLSASSGRITVPVDVEDGLTPLQVAGNGTSRVVIIAPSLTIFSTLAAQAAVYEPNSGFSGEDRVWIEVDDRDSSSYVKPALARDSLRVHVVEELVWLAPDFRNVVTDAELSFGMLSEAGIALADLRATPGELELILEVEQGGLSVTPATGVTIVAGNGPTEPLLRMRGTSEVLSESLATLVYTPEPAFGGQDLLTLVATDLADPPQELATAAVVIGVNQLGGAPVISIYDPRPLIVGTNGRSTIPGVILSNDDRGLSELVLRLRSYHGRFEIETEGSGSGLADSAVFGAGTSEVEIHGNQTQLELLLTSLEGLVYVPDAHYRGEDLIELSLDDQGAVGTAGPQKDINAIRVWVTSDPVATGPTTQTIESGSLFFSDLTDNGLHVYGFREADEPATVTVSVTSGLLRLASSDPEDEGEAELEWTDDLDAIDAELQGLEFVPSESFSGVVSLVVTVRATARPESTGYSTTVQIAVNHTNSAPSIRVDRGEAIVASTTATTISGIAVEDSDALGAPVRVTFSVKNGELLLRTDVADGLEPYDLFGNGTSEVTVWSSLDRLAETLTAEGGLVYEPNDSMVEDDVLRIVIDDRGNTGGTLGLAVGTIRLRVTDRLLHELPVGPWTPLNTPLTLSTELRSAVRIVDFDAAERELLLEVEASHGRLRWSTAEPETEPVSSLTLEGTLEELNEALDGLEFIPDTEFRGTAQLGFRTSDSGHSLGPLTAEDVLAIGVGVLNQSPRLIVPDQPLRFEVESGVPSPVALSAVSIEDSDAGGSPLELVLVTPSGTLEVLADGLASLRPDQVDRLSPQSIVLRGTVEQLNRALQSNGVFYIPPTGFSGLDYVVLRITDLGNSGAGGAKEDAEIVRFAGPLVNYPPVVSVPAYRVQVQANEVTALDPVEGLGIAFDDEDAEDESFGAGFIARNGRIRIPASAVEDLTFLMGEADEFARAVFFAGARSDIAAALAAVEYLPDTNFFGPDDVRVFVTDFDGEGTPGIMGPGTTEVSYRFQVLDPAEPIELEFVDAEAPGGRLAYSLGNLDTLAENGPGHTYLLEAAAGQRLSLRVEPDPTAPTLAPVVTVFDPRLRQVVTRSAERGTPLILNGIELPSDGIYEILVSAGGASFGRFTLDVVLDGGYSSTHRDRGEFDSLESPRLDFGATSTRWTTVGSSQALRQLGSWDGATGRLITAFGGISEFQAANDAEGNPWRTRVVLDGPYYGLQEGDRVAIRQPFSLNEFEGEYTIHNVQVEPAPGQPATFDIDVPFDVVKNGHFGTWQLLPDTAWNYGPALGVTLLTEFEERSIALVGHVDPNSGVDILDVSDPLAPVLLANFRHAEEAQEIVSLTPGDDLWITRITTAGPHSLQNGATVRIEGTGPYDGEFQVFGVTSDSFAISFHYAGPANGTWRSVVGNQITGLAVKDHYAFLASNNGGGILVLDISDPAAPAEVTKLVPISPAQRFFAIAVAGDLLFAVGDESGDVIVYDVSDPADPTPLPTIETGELGLLGVSVRDNLLYTAVPFSLVDPENPALGVGGFVDVYDLTDYPTTDAVRVSRLETGLTTAFVAPTDDGDHLVITRLGAEFDTAAALVSIWDISDFENPVQVAGIDPEDWGATAFGAGVPVVDGSTLYISMFQSGLQAFDITDPANPQRLGELSVVPTDAFGLAFAGMFGLGPQLGSQSLLVTDFDRGLFVVDGRPDEQTYQLDLTRAVGKPLDILLRGIDSQLYADAVIELYGPPELPEEPEVEPPPLVLLATSESYSLGLNSERFDQGILGYTIADPGLYTILVRSRASGRYELVVGADLTLTAYQVDGEQSEPKSLDDLSAAAGYLEDSSPIQYTLTLPADEPFRAWTETPGWGESVLISNLVDPALTLRNSSDEIVAFNSSAEPGAKNALLQYVPASAGVYTLEISREDSATGGYVLHIEQAAVNNPPSLTQPASLVTGVDETIELVAVGGGPLKVADPDSGDSGIEISIAVEHGTLNWETTSGTSTDSSSSGTITTYVLAGPVMALNELLATLAFTPSMAFLGTAHLAITVDDLGNTGSGGPQIVASELNIQVRERNAPPGLVFPGPQRTARDTRLVFAPGGDNRIAIEPSLGTEDHVFRIELEAEEGTLLFGPTAGATVVAGASGTSAITLDGRATVLNELLSGFAFDPENGFTGVGQLTITAGDLGLDGLGEPAEVSGEVRIAVDHRNQAPTISGSEWAYRGWPNEATHLSGIGIADADAGDAVLLVRLEVGEGTLQIDTEVDGGIEASQVTGNNSDTIDIRASLAQLQATLLESTALTYQPGEPPEEFDELTVTVDDLGNTGLGGPRRVERSFEIVISDEDLGSTIHAPNVPWITEIDEPIVLTGLTIENSDEPTGVQVVVRVEEGTLSLVDIDLEDENTISVSSDGTMVTLEGSLEWINATLGTSGGPEYTPKSGWGGLDRVYVEVNATNGASVLHDELESPLFLAVVEPLSYTDLGELVPAPTIHLPETTYIPRDSTLEFPEGGPGQIWIEDSSSPEATLVVRLEVSNGSLELSGSTGLSLLEGTSVSGRRIAVSGLVSDINAALAGMVFDPGSGFTGSVYLDLWAARSTETSAGLAGQASDSLTVRVQARAEPPVIVSPSSILATPAVALLVGTTESPLSVSAPGVGDATISVNLTANFGSLRAVLIGGTILTKGDESGANTLSLTGSVADVNATLETLEYLADRLYRGPDLIRIVVDDLAHNGTASRQKATALVEVALAPVSLPPLLNLPTNLLRTDEGEPLLVAESGHFPPSIKAPDLADDRLAVTIQVAAGTLSIVEPGPAEVVQSSSEELVLTGSESEVNKALLSLTLTPDDYWNGSLTIDLSVQQIDDEDTPQLAEPVTGQMRVYFSAGQGSPRIRLPELIRTEEDQPIALSTRFNIAVFINDQASSASLTTAVSVERGSLILPAEELPAGLVISPAPVESIISGDSITLTGSWVDINDALSRLSYVPETGEVYESRLTVTNEFSTLSPNRLASDSVPIQVVPPSGEPEHQGTAPRTVGTGSLLGFGGSEPLEVVDPYLTTDLVQVTVLAEAGEVSLNQSWWLPGLSFAGTLAEVNQKLELLRFRPEPGFLGTANLRIITSDLGNSRDGIVLEATDDVEITVVDARFEWSVPGPQLLAENDILLLSSATSDAIDLTYLEEDEPEELQTIQLTLGASHGLVSLPDETEYESPASSITLEGTVSEIRALLASGVLFSPDEDYQGEAAIDLAAVVVAGGGTIGSTASIPITVSNLNQPPVNRLPDDLAVRPNGYLVLSSALGNAIRIEDPDAGSAPLEVVVLAQYGTFRLAGQAGLEVFTNTGRIASFRGNLAAINAAFDGVVFRPEAEALLDDPEAQPTLTIVTNDLGNSGIGGPLVDEDDLVISVESINLPPTIAAPLSAFVGEDEVLTLSAATDNGIVLDDPDAAEEAQLELTLMTAVARMTLATDTGLAFLNGSGTSDRFLRVRGTLEDLNAALDGLTIGPFDEDSPDDALTISLNDLADEELGGPAIATRVLQIGRALGLELPTSLTGQQDSTLYLPELALLGLASTDLVRVSLWAEHGRLYLDSIFDSSGVELSGHGLTFESLDHGWDSSFVAFEGTLDDVTEALSEIRFEPESGYAGHASLRLLAGATLGDRYYSVEGIVPITLAARLFNPEFIAPVSQVTTQNQAVAFSQAQGNAVRLADRDAGLEPLLVTLTPQHGTIVVPDEVAGVTQSVDEPSGTVSLEGTLEKINHALDGLKFIPDLNYVGTAGIDLAADDLRDELLSGGTAEASIAIDVGLGAVGLSVSVPPVQYVGINGDAFTLPDSPLRISQYRGNGINLQGNIDESEPIKIRFAVAHGTLALPVHDGLTVDSEDPLAVPTGTPSFSRFASGTLIGTLSTWQAVFAGIAGSNGSETGGLLYIPNPVSNSSTAPREDQIEILAMGRVITDSTTSPTTTMEQVVSTGIDVAIVDVPQLANLVEFNFNSRNEDGVDLVPDFPTNIDGVQTNDTWGEKADFSYVRGYVLLTVGDDSSLGTIAAEVEFDEDDDGEADGRAYTWSTSGATSPANASYNTFIYFPSRPEEANQTVSSVVSARPVVTLGDPILGNRLYGEWKSISVQFAPNLPKGPTLPGNELIEKPPVIAIQPAMVSGFRPSSFIRTAGGEMVTSELQFEGVLSGDIAPNTPIAIYQQKADLDVGVSFNSFFVDNTTTIDPNLLQLLGWAYADADGRFTFQTDRLVPDFVESLYGTDNVRVRLWAVARDPIPGHPELNYTSGLENRGMVPLEFILTPTEVGVVDLQLLDPSDSETPPATIDPTIIGRVTGLDDALGTAVQLSIGEPHDPWIVYADAGGQFQFTLPDDVDSGSIELTATVLLPDGSTEVVAEPAELLFNLLGISGQPEVEDLAADLLPSTAANGSAGSYLLTGQVVYAGQVANGLIEIDINGDSITDLTTRTDESGSFVVELPTLALGEVELQVRATGVDTIRGRQVIGDWSTITFTAQVALDPNLLVIELALLNDTSEGDLDTTDPTLTGQIASSGTVALQTVQFAYGAESSVVEASVLTDRAGRFQFTPLGLEPNTTSNEVTVRARVKAIDQFGDERTSPWSSLTFDYHPPTGTPEISDFQWLDNPDAQLRPVVTGTVSGLSAPSGTIVQISYAGNELVDATATVDSQGHFTHSLALPEEGTYEVQVRAVSQVYSVAEGWETQYSAWQGLPGAGLVTFSPTSTVSGVTIASLFLRGEDGKPIEPLEPIDPPESSHPVLAGEVTSSEGFAGFIVRFTFAGHPQAEGSAFLDANGRFSFRPVGLPVDLEIAVTAQLFRLDPGADLPAAGDTESLTFVVTESDFEIPTIDEFGLVFPVDDDPLQAIDSTIVGQLSFAGGGDFRNVSLEYSLGDDELPVTTGYASVLADGSFRFVPAIASVGDNSLRVRVRRWNPAERTYSTGEWSDPLEFELLDPAMEVLPTIVEFALLNPGQSDPLVSTSSDTTVAGRVEYSLGSVAHVKVELVDGSDVSLGYTFTDAFGSFSFHPAGLNPSVEITIKARAVVPSATGGDDIAGDWETLTFTRTIVTPDPGYTPTDPFGDPAVFEQVVSDFDRQAEACLQTAAFDAAAAFNELAFSGRDPLDPGQVYFPHGAFNQFVGQLGAAAGRSAQADLAAGEPAPLPNLLFPFEVLFPDHTFTEANVLSDAQTKISTGGTAEDQFTREDTQTLGYNLTLADPDPLTGIVEFGYTIHINTEFIYRRIQTTGDLASVADRIHDTPTLYDEAFTHVFKPEVDRDAPARVPAESPAPPSGVPDLVWFQDEAPSLQGRFQNFNQRGSYDLLFTLSGSFTPAGVITASYGFTEASDYNYSAFDAVYNKLGLQSIANENGSSQSRSSDYRVTRGSTHRTSLRTDSDGAFTLDPSDDSYSIGVPERTPVPESEGQYISSLNIAESIESEYLVDQGDQRYQAASQSWDNGPTEFASSSSLAESNWGQGRRAESVETTTGGSYALSASSQSLSLFPRTDRASQLHYQGGGQSQSQSQSAQSSAALSAQSSGYQSSSYSGQGSRSDVTSESAGFSNEDSLVSASRQFFRTVRASDTVESQGNGAAQAKVHAALFDTASNDGFYGQGQSALQVSFVDQGQLTGVGAQALRSGNRQLATDSQLDSTDHAQGGRSQHSPGSSAQTAYADQLHSSADSSQGVSLAYHETPTAQLYDGTTQSQALVDQGGKSQTSGNSQRAGQGFSESQTDQGRGNYQSTDQTRTNSTFTVAGSDYLVSADSQLARSAADDFQNDQLLAFSRWAADTSSSGTLQSAAQSSASATLTGNSETTASPAASTTTADATAQVRGQDNLSGLLEQSYTLPSVVGSAVGLQQSASSQVLRDKFQLSGDSSSPLRQGSLATLGGNQAQNHLIDNYQVALPDGSAQVLRTDHAQGNSSSQSSLGYRSQAGLDQLAGSLGANRNTGAKSDSQVKVPYHFTDGATTYQGQLDNAAGGRLKQATQSAGTTQSTSTQGGATESDTQAHATSQREQNTSGNSTDKGTFSGPEASGSYTHQLTRGNHDESTAGQATDGSRDPADSSSDSQLKRDSQVTENYNTADRSGTRNTHTVATRNTDGTQDKPGAPPTGQGAPPAAADGATQGNQSDSTESTVHDVGTRTLLDFTTRTKIHYDTTEKTGGTWNTGGQLDRTGGASDRQSDGQTNKTSGSSGTVFWSQAPLNPTWAFTSTAFGTSITGQQAGSQDESQGSELIDPAADTPEKQSGSGDSSGKSKQHDLSGSYLASTTRAHVTLLGNEYTITNKANSSTFEKTSQSAKRESAGQNSQTTAAPPSGSGSTSPTTTEKRSGSGSGNSNDQSLVVNRAAEHRTGYSLEGGGVKQYTVEAKHSIRTEETNDTEGSQGLKPVTKDGQPAGTRHTTTSGGKLDTASVIETVRKERNDLPGGEWNSQELTTTQRPKYHSYPQSTRTFGPAGADEDGAGGGGSGSGGGPGSGSGGAPPDWLTFGLVPSPPAGGYPGGSTDYVLTFSGSSDVSDFSDYELKRETKNFKPPKDFESDPISITNFDDVTRLGGLTTITTESYTATRDTDDVKLGLPTADNPQGITGGSSPHTATSFTRTRQVDENDVAGPRRFRTYAYIPFWWTDILVNVALDETRIRDEAQWSDYSENSKYDAQGDKSGSYFRQEPHSVYEHREVSDWFGRTATGSGYDWLNAPPPPPLNWSTFDSRSTIYDGHFQADKLIEQITYDPVPNAGQPQAKPIALGGSGVFQTLGPGAETVDEPSATDTQWYNDSWTDWINPVSWIGWVHAGLKSIGTQIGEGISAFDQFDDALRRSGDRQESIVNHLGHDNPDISTQDLGQARARGLQEAAADVSDMMEGAAAATDLASIVTATGELGYGALAVVRVATVRAEARAVLSGAVRNTASSNAVRDRVLGNIAESQAARQASLKPPGWNHKWTLEPPSGEAAGAWRWWDPNGGEWRWHAPDSWHPKGHWDHNPWSSWNSPWQNIPYKAPGS